MTIPTLGSGLYAIVGDASPTTQVFRFSDSTYVSSTDATYLASIGAIPGVIAVTGAANNGSGAIRLTTGPGATGLLAYQTVQGVAGTTEANANWAITIIDDNTIDLVGSTFTNAYTSGGKVSSYYIATTTLLNAQLASYALQNFNARGPSINTISSAVDVVLTNPVATYQYVTFSAPSKKITLPSPGMINSMPLGVEYVFINAGAYAWSFYSSDGSSSTVCQVGQTARVTFKVNDSLTPSAFVIDCSPSANDFSPHPFAWPNTDGQTIIASSASGQPFWAVTANYAAYDAFSVHGADVASATTTNLETATGNLVDVTGTVTITAITLSDGHERTVRFTGALTLTNGASLVLPGAANITTVAGDFAIFRGYASSVVRCVGYFPIGAYPINRGGSGQITAYAAYDAFSVHGADVASATTTVLDGTTGNLVDVTGTVTITAITLANGLERTVRFTGALILTHGASLVLPTQANITTVAGDFAIFRGYAGGVVRCVTYQPVNARLSNVSLAWSPVIQFGGVTTDATYSAAPNGRYTRIGPLVFGDFNFNMTNKGTKTGACTIIGLPVAVGGPDTGFFVISYYANLATITLAGGYISAAGTTISLTNGGAATLAALTDANFTNTAQIYGTFAYLAA